MGCNNLCGIQFECLNNTGGISNIYIGHYSDINSITISNGLITAMSLKKQMNAYFFNKNTSSILEEAQISLENGTTWYKTTTTLVIPYRDVTKRNEIVKLYSGQPNLIVIIKDYNGKYWFKGYSGGANLTGLSSGSGTTKTDLNGYTITLTSEEKKLTYEVDSSVMTDCIIAVGCQPTPEFSGIYVEPDCDGSLVLYYEFDWTGFMTCNDFHIQAQSDSGGPWIDLYDFTTQPSSGTTASTTTYTLDPDITPGNYNFRLIDLISGASVETGPGIGIPSC